MILDFLNFIKNPVKLKKSKVNLKKIITCYLFFLVSYILISFVSYSVISCLGINLEFNSLSESTFNSNILILAIISAPISEELLFRAVLKPNRKTFALFAFSLFFLFLKLFELTFFFKILLSILLSIFVYLLKFDISSYVYKNFNVIVYFSSFLFGLVHIFNFTLTYSIYIGCFLLILPKIYLGFILSYLRIKFGLFSNIFFHSLMNGVLIYLGTYD